MHKRYPRSSDLRFSTDPQSVLKFLKRSSKPSKSLRSPQKVSKATSIPQNVINVPKILWSSKVPQMVIKWSSQSPQKFLKTVLKWFHKKSSKVPERFFNVLRSSCPQVFKKSSKGPQSPQKVKKMHKRYPRSSDLRFSTDPQNVLKFLKRSSKPSKSSEVHKRYSRRPQFLKTLSTSFKILWSSKVPQMVIKWSSQSPQKFLKTVLKWSARSHQKFLKGSSMFWDPHVHRSSKSPQKVHKVLKKSRKCTKGTQRPQVAGSQLIRKMSSNSTNGYQSPRSPQVFKAISKSKNLSTSSKSSVGSQVREDPQCPEKSFNSSKASGPQ